MVTTRSWRLASKRVPSWQRWQLPHSCKPWQATLAVALPERSIKPRKRHSVDSYGVPLRKTGEIHARSSSGAPRVGW